MKTRLRDQVIVGSAVLGVIATAGLVVAAVRQAEREGLRALERLQVAQVQQLTRSMNTRMESSFKAFQGIADSKPAWTAKLRDRSDADRIQYFLDLNPTARTGMLIVDADGVITNGTLLRDKSVVGTKLTRPGLDAILAGKAGAVLPVAPGLTTPLPTIALAFPLRANGTVIGAFVAESDVSTESNFNAEVAELKLGRTGEFSFIDEAGVVVASSDAGSLGRALDEPLLRDGRTGFARGGGRIAIAETVPAAGWRTVFRQDAAEFEGSLTGPLRSALLLVVLLGVVGAGIALVQLARRLRRAREEQLRLEEINTAREDFIGIVSNELRTPVTGLFGFLQTAIDDWDLMSDDERRRALTRSLASARTLHTLTRNVLDTSSMESGELEYEMETLDLRTSVTEAVEVLRTTQPERTVMVSLPEVPVWVHADGDRMRQVLTNLLENAAKSSPRLSPVEIAVGRSGSRAAVRITDHGPDFSAGELSRVFDKFVRGRSTGSVGGLGLYLCRQVVEAHGGDIHAEPADPSGAVFVLELPLSDQRQPISG